MTKILLFGGTSEGRMLAEMLQQKGVSTLVCVATDYGETLLHPDGCLKVHTGRLNKEEMMVLLNEEWPERVIDATHPYASLVSTTLKTVCEDMGVSYLRVEREPCHEEGCIAFDGMQALVSWLNSQPGVIFSTLGAKEAAELAYVRNYRDRVWLRILPSMDSLAVCLKTGMPAGHIICMQGPFSVEMNTAMLRSAKAQILVTKESGVEGGFVEKLAAAKGLGIQTAVLQRPIQGKEKGLSLQEMMLRIQDGSI